MNNRQYVIIWKDECEGKHMFDEYCNMSNAQMINDEFDVVDEDGDGVRFYTCPERMKIEVEITEGDIELFRDIVYNNDTLDWQYDTAEGVPIDVEFISEDELEQRNR